MHENNLTPISFIADVGGALVYDSDVGLYAIAEDGQDFFVVRKGMSCPFKETCSDVGKSVAKHLVVVAVIFGIMAEAALQQANQILPRGSYSAVPAS